MTLEETLLSSCSSCPAHTGTTHPAPEHRSAPISTDSAPCAVLRYRR